MLYIIYAFYTKCNCSQDCLVILSINKKLGIVAPESNDGTYYLSDGTIIDL